MVDQGLRQGITSRDYLFKRIGVPKPKEKKRLLARAKGD